MLQLNRTVSRTVLAVCAAVVVGTVAGCGNGGDAGAAEKPAARNGDESRSNSRVVSQREAESFALHRKDIPGYTIQTLAGRGEDAQVPVRLFAGGLPRIEPAECQPVYENTQQGSAYRQYARTDALVSGHGDFVEVALVAYGVGDARKALADLREALARCRSFTMPLDRTEHFEYPRLLPDPHLGDEAVEYTITQKIDGDEGAIRAPFHHLVVRKGSVIAWFMVHGFPGEPPKLPANVVDTQLAKLR
ncbi:sensor domain-containing protein [Streptomyces sp. ME19-03-3]|nr:sensor domain-containing protein [Streptomyces sp. ME19-03-3]